MVSDRSLAGLRALVVEDEYFIADDLKRILRSRGADLVILSGSVDDAFRRIGDGGFEVALLDLNVRGEMTFPVADELVRRSIPFAFVSGYAKSAAPARFARVPLWGKPYDEQRLVDELCRFWIPPARA